MTVGSLAHRRLTIGLFIVVIGAVFVVNSYVYGGLRAVASTLLTCAIVFVVGFALNWLWVRR